LHQVEALVRLARTVPADPLTLFILQALTLTERAAHPGPRPADEWLGRLNERLHLGPQVLRQALRGLEAEGMVQAAPDGTWTVTALGRHALDRKEFPRATRERRSFHFVESTAENSAARPAPQFLPLHNSSGIPWPAAEGRDFDVRALAACVARAPEWKRKHGFPLDVQEVLLLPEEGGEKGTEPPARGGALWERVILDRPERVLAVLVLTTCPEGGPQLVGLPVRQDGWVLQAGTPLFNLGEGWQEVFPDLAEEPSPEVWRQAWRAWCEPRGLPAGEVNACTLERQGERLRVTAPPSLVERLRVTRSDALRGEAWLLAGEGPVRAAAVVELVEAG
jgi:hypothetical protein